MSDQMLKNQLMAEIVTLFQMEPMARLIERIQGEGRVLFYLKEHPEQANPSQISQYLSLSKPRVTSILNALRKKEFVELQADPADRRRVNVVLTQAGIDYIALKVSHTEAMLDEYIGGMGRESTEELISLLIRTNEVMYQQTQNYHNED